MSLRLAEKRGLIQLDLRLTEAFGFHFARFSFLLELAELGRIFFVATVQARILELQISDLLFVREEGMKVDKSWTGGGSSWANCSANSV